MCVFKNLLVQFENSNSSIIPEGLVLVVTLSLRLRASVVTSPTEACLSLPGAGAGRQLGVAQSTRLAASAVLICCQKPGMFLESRCSLVHDESFEMLVLISEGISGSHQGKSSGQQEGRPGQKTGRCSSPATPFYLGCYQKVFALSSPINQGNRAVLQVWLLAKVILSCVKLA